MRISRIPWSDTPRTDEEAALRVAAIAVAIALAAYTVGSLLAFVWLCIH